MALTTLLLRGPECGTIKEKHKKGQQKHRHCTVPCTLAVQLNLNTVQM